MQNENPAPQPQEERHTFEVPEGFEAVRDADGRATGELRPKSPAPQLQLSGIELAARFVENRRDDYVREHGSFDPYTGATEFPGNGDEYVFELEEIIAGIRALARSEATVR